MEFNHSHERSASEESSQSVDVDEKDESVLGSQVTGSSDLPIKRDIYLHLEVLNSKQHKAAQAVWVVLMCAGIALVATTIYLRLRAKKHYEEYLRDAIIFKLNTAFAVICFSLLLPMLAWFSYRIWATRKCIWTRRQRYIVSLAYLQLAFQCVNALFWLIPNAFLLANKCSYFDAVVNACIYIRWTCWNSIFFLLLVHTHNCMPVLKTANKKEDPWPDRDNPLYGNNDRDPMVLDGPFWRMHWIRFLYWCVVEASILFLPASGGIDWKKEATIPAPPFCAGSRLQHIPGLKYRIVLVLWGFALIIYQSATQINLKRALFKLHTQPYNCYQLGNLLLLWQKRQGLWMDLLGMVEVSYVYLTYETIVSYLLQWTGQLALQVLMTGATLLSAFYFLPMEPANEEHIYQAWLQEFAWTEDQIPKRQRALLKRSPTMATRLQDKPMFCFETALKLLLWSDLVYEHASDKGAPGLAEPVRAELQAEVDACDDKAPAGEGEIATGGPSAQAGTPSGCPKVVLQQEGKGLQDARRRSSSGDSAEACSVFPTSAEHVKLTDTQDSCREEAGSECARDPDAELGDTKPSHSILKVVEVLSNEEQLQLGLQMFGLEHVKVFHGPVTDTKVVVAWSSRAMLLAFRGTNSLANVRSDAKAWRTAHLPRRGSFLLGTMPLVHKGFLHAWMEVAEEVLQHVAHVLLAAEVPLLVFPVYITGHSLGGALATLAAFDIQKTHQLASLTCYTLGAPRTGNKAFADEFTHLCPNCWHIINDRDAVPRTGKLLWLYKRPGERVLLSSLGDIRVRPNIFEINLLTQGFSVKQHLLNEYLRAMGAICVAQLFKHKRLEGGKRGVARLSESPEICKLLGSIGIDLESALKHPPLEMRAVKRRKRCKCWTGRHILDALRESQPFLND